MAAQVATSFSAATSARRDAIHQSPAPRRRIRAAVRGFVGRPSPSSGQGSGGGPARASEPIAMDLRRHVVGIGERVPTLSGRLVRYLNLDNAATTPAMHVAIAAVSESLPHYGSVHRGSGYNARCSTAAYEQARATIAGFVGADADRDTVVFTKNTTEAINMLARSMPVDDGDVVLTTALEHHSNDLPWRARQPTYHVGARPDGSLDLDDLDRKLSTFHGRIALLAVSGASNVTGVAPPIHEIARRVHRAGGRLLVDAAQLAAHRPIDMRAHDDPAHLDFVALSAHKLYAPFGSGALVGARAGFGPVPDSRGGGTVDAVTLDEVVWTGLPHRQEAGTPNLAGAVSFAAAVSQLGRLGWDSLIAHERRLHERLLAGLARVPAVTVFGPNDPSTTIAVVPFSVDGIAPGLVAAILGYEHGIGVRSGCFCAQPYMAHLLGWDGPTAQRWVERARRGDLTDHPGLVRVSLGFYNDASDVDRLLDAIERIVAGDVEATYRPDEHGEYRPDTLTQDADAVVTVGARHQP